MNAKLKDLRDMWMWQAPLLSVTVGVFVLVPILIACVLYPSRGVMGLMALPFASIGVAGGLVYGWVVRRVARLRQSASAEEGEAVYGLIVNGIIQSPGVVVLKAGVIEFLPIVGKPLTIPVEAIDSVRTCRWFNGTYYLWKTGFWLKVLGRDRLGFAVATSLAGKWRGLLESTKVPEGV